MSLRVRTNLLMLQQALLLSILILSSMWETSVLAIKDASIKRIFTEEELSRYKGKDDGPIYLSVLGEVYDVTTGKDYYSGDSGYSYFAGRDGSHSFFTGDFTEDGVKDEKSLLEYDVKSVKAIEHWRKFYETHETYTYVGLLQGQYYDAEGEQTPYLQSIMAMISSNEL